MPSTAHRDPGPQRRQHADTERPEARHGAILHRPDGAAAGLPAMRALDAAPELPHIEAGAARLANWLSCRAAPLALHARDADWLLRFVPHDDRIAGRDANAYAFTLGPCHGRLLFDIPAERYLLGTPGEGEALPALLRQALMADALQAAVAAVAGAQTDAFAWQPGAAAFPSNAQCFGFELTRSEDPARTTAPVAPARLRGVLQLDQPERLAALPARADTGGDAARAAWLERLRVPLAVRIGTTHIAVGEMRDVQPGDIVSIESWQSQAGALVVQCTTGQRGLSWTALAEGRRITVQAPQGTARAADMTSKDGAHMDPREQRDERNGAQDDIPHPDAERASLSRLDNLEVTLRFEVGDVDIALAELRTVRPGYVFELPQPLKQSEVRIVANGRMIGTGTLIAVGNRLGVRVSSFAAGDA